MDKTNTSDVLQYKNLIWKIINDIKKTFNLNGIEEDDLFQEAILVMLNNTKKYNPQKSSFSSFMYPTIRRDLIRYIKKQQRSPIYICNYEDDEHSSVLCEAKQELDKEEKELFIAYYENDYSQNTIAKKYNISKQAVSKRLKKINDKIRLTLGIKQV